MKQSILRVNFHTMNRKYYRLYYTWSLDGNHYGTDNVKRVKLIYFLNSGLSKEYIYYD